MNDRPSPTLDACEAKELLREAATRNKCHVLVHKVIQFAPQAVHQVGLNVVPCSTLIYVLLIRGSDAFEDANQFVVGRDDFLGSICRALHGYVAHIHKADAI